MSKRNPNFFDAMEHMSDEEARKFVYGTKQDRRDGVIAGIFLASVYGAMIIGAFTIWL